MRMVRGQALQLGANVLNDRAIDRQKVSGVA